MLKKYASIVNTIAIVFAALSMAAGIYLGIETESVLPVLYTAIAAVVFYIFAKAFSELLYATAKNQEDIQNVADMLKKNEIARPVAPEMKPRSATASTKAVAAPVEPEKANAPAETASYRIDETNADFIICNKCGTRQRSNRTVCFECSAKLK